MVNGVFVHRADSIYDDFLDKQYQFPKRYLKRAKSVEGNWIAYYEPRRGGRQGYNAIAKVQEIIADPSVKDMYLALIEAGSYTQLENFVPLHSLDGYIESSLKKVDGSLNMGLIQWAIRQISNSDFLRLLDKGFSAEESTLNRDDSVTPMPGLLDPDQHFVFDDERSRIEQTITKIDRNRVFRKHVLEAYDSRCAFTGLKLINGGGRAEVEAAHIKPVKDNGPDIIQNGIALSGTVHWMFDRGLISLSNEADILVSRQANDPQQIWDLVSKSRKANLPNETMLRPHSAYLEWHRDKCFKQ